MKKIVLLLLAVITLASYTKAQEVKQQFVKWETVPSPSDVKVAWLKSAMKGESIPGASVRSTAATYKAVWGDDLYNKVLNADESRFGIYRSKGGEVNWAVGANGAAVQSGTLDENVWVITLDVQEIAKWGKNGCLNAISFLTEVADGDDPDNKKPGSKPSPNNGSMSMTNGSNSITFSGNPGGPNANDALFYFKDGLKTQQASEDASAIRFMAVSSNSVANANLLSNNCNSCGSTGYSAPPNIYAAPMVYAAPSIAAAPQPAANMYASNSNMNVTVRNKANGWDIANTVLNGANTFLNGVNTYRGVRLEQPRVAYSNMQSSYYGNTNPTGFQGSSILGQTYTSNQINTSNGNGGYSNTQIW